MWKSEDRFLKIDCVRAVARFVADGELGRKLTSVSVWPVIGSELTF
jgi:hypothetical protein